jgi:hypothetical protein
MGNYVLKCGKSLLVLCPLKISSGNGKNENNMSQKGFLAGIWTLPEHKPVFQFQCQICSQEIRQAFVNPGKS